LLRIGRSARGALLQGTRHDDPEIRTRCRNLLLTILDLDLKARIEAFLADPGGAIHDLPGWERFRSVTGDSRSSRELFAMMLHADARLMESSEINPRSAADLLASRCAVIQQNLYTGSRVPPSLGDVLNVLFVGSDVRMNVAPITIQMTYQFLFQPSFRNSLHTGEQGELVKKLLLHWVERHRGEPTTSHNLLSTATILQLRELLPAAVAIAGDPKLAVHTRATALTVIGRLGDKRHIADLSPVLTEKTQIGNFNFNNASGTTQLRDVALAMMIKLSGQEPQSYGYEALRSNPGLLYSYYYLGFPSDAKRDAAFQKWAASQAAGPK
jgi:hypothetical protein